jgi:pyridoxamine 5'-phosphate oxidase family protein
MTTHRAPFTEAELAYLSGQQLGRLATVAPDGTPQNNPVGFHWNPDTATIDIYGLNMGASRKFRNAREFPPVAFVVDDIASVDPWTVRGVEIRGQAEALDDIDPPRPGMSREVLRIHAHRIISWGFDGTRTMHGRDVASARQVA